MDIRSFLQRTPPFDELDDDALDEVVRHTSIAFFPRGEIVLQQGGEPAEHLYVVRTGAVEALDGDHVVDLHQPGEVFGYVSLLTGEEPGLTTRAHEDAICYLVLGEVAARVLASRPGVSFLSRTVRRRELSLLADVAVAERADPWAAPVGALVRRPPVAVDARESIRAAAEAMSRERVSALLVRMDGGWGIVTDRDLRSRVLAVGRSDGDPIVDVASSPVVTTSADMPVSEVLAMMLERRINHVPVMDVRGDLTGLVTVMDLMALERRSAFRLRRDIESSVTAEEIAEIAKAIPSTLADLIEGSAEPLEVAHVAAVTNDTLTRRLLELGIARLGEPPARWSWLALGSEARFEQGMATDQDNALVYESDGDEDVDGYFAELAAFVNEGLAGAGLPRCRAGVLASNPEWRGTIPTWVERFQGWIGDPSRTGSAFSGIAFDFRPVSGPLEVRTSLDPVIRQAGREREFLRHLAAGALAQRPPRGFLKDAIVEARGTSAVTLDVKQAGIGPITNLARIHGLRIGSTGNRTVLRLRAAAADGVLTEDEGQALEEAFRLLWRTRLDHQAGRVRGAALPDDEVDPRSLGPLARQALKEAFRAIARAQEGLAMGLGLRW
jgi:CBS domain-containing protein